MVIGERLKALRKQKKMAQGDTEKRTGLLRCYISRIENGHTVPSVDTLEKMARALEVRMYRLVTDDDYVKKPIVRQKLFGAGRPAQNRTASIVLCQIIFAQG